MGLVIEDGTGRGYKASVDEEHRLTANAIDVSKLEHNSEAHGTAFVWTSTYAATGGQEVLSIQNDEANLGLHIQSVHCGASGAASVFTILEVTTGTPAGTTVTPSNMDLGSGVVKSQTAFGNASVTGSVDGDAIGFLVVADGEDHHMDFEGALILNNTQKIAIRSSGTATVYVTVFGYWNAVDL